MYFILIIFTLFPNSAHSIPLQLCVLYFFFNLSSLISVGHILLGVAIHWSLFHQPGPTCINKTSSPSPSSYVFPTEGGHGHGPLKSKKGEGQWECWGRRVRWVDGDFRWSDPSLMKRQNLTIEYRCLINTNFKKCIANKRQIQMIS